MKFHIHPFTCDHCGRAAQILEVSFTADGQMNFEGICVRCNATVSLTISIWEITAECHLADEQEDGLYFPQ